MKSKILRVTAIIFAVLALIMAGYFVLTKNGSLLFVPIPAILSLIFSQIAAKEKNKK